VRGTNIAALFYDKPDTSMADDKNRSSAPRLY
jgi:hypothetical protein